MAADPARIARLFIVAGPIALSLLLVDGAVSPSGQGAALAIIAALIAGVSAAWSP